MNALPDIDWKQLRAVATKIESAKEQLKTLQISIFTGNEKERLGEAADKLSYVLELLRNIKPEEVPLMLENELHCELCGSQLTYRMDAFPS